MMLRRPLTVLRLSAALVLATTALAPTLPLSSGWTTGATAFAQGTGDQATLETRQPEVQWSPVGASDWQAVPTQQTVGVGDRVRTGAGAAARLVYFEGSVTEISADTGLSVQRLERSPDGNIVTRLFQSAGTTINRVVRLTDAAASFEIETPAATALVRGTTPQVTVDSATGNTRVSNVPDNTGGLVRVQGTDQGTTTVTLQPGEETTIRPGQAPSTPTQMSNQQQQQQQPPFSQDQQQQTAVMMQQQQMQQASAMMAGQAIAANFAAQSSLMNAAAAQQIQNQLIINQLNASPNFPFSNINVASGTVRLR
jgi:hypothetical protein